METIVELPALPSTEDKFYVMWAYDKQLHFQEYIVEDNQLYYFKRDENRFIPTEIQDEGWFHSPIKHVKIFCLKDDTLIEA